MAPPRFCRSVASSPIKVCPVASRRHGVPSQDDDGASCIAACTRRLGLLPGRGCLCLSAYSPGGEFYWDAAGLDCNASGCSLIAQPVVALVAAPPPRAGTMTSRLASQSSLGCSPAAPASANAAVAAGCSPQVAILRGGARHRHLLDWLQARRLRPRFLWHDLCAALSDLRLRGGNGAGPAVVAPPAPFPALPSFFLVGGGGWPSASSWIPILSSTAASHTKCGPIWQAVDSKSPAALLPCARRGRGSRSRPSRVVSSPGCFLEPPSPASPSR